MSGPCIHVELAAHSTQRPPKRVLLLLSLMMVSAVLRSPLVSIQHDMPIGPMSDEGAICLAAFSFVNQREWGRFNLNQQWLFLSRTADGSRGIDLGFRVDLIYGVDGNDTQAFGNNPGRYDFQNGWDFGIYEWALPQLYGQVAWGSLSVKLGHFLTTVGYEVVPSPDNFFLSHQLTFYNSEPFTHTGALGNYRLHDTWEIVGGWVLGWDTGFDQFNQSNAFLGGLVDQVTEDTTLTYMMLGGNLGTRGDGSIHSILLTHDWSDQLTSVHQFDVLNCNATNAAGERTNFATDGVPGDSIGQINYLFYRLNDRVRAGLREEWYKADGISYYTLTYGFNLFPGRNVTIRPEVRHLWSPGNDLAYGADLGDRIPLFNQTVLGIDVILTF